MPAASHQNSIARQLSRKLLPLVLGLWLLIVVGAPLAYWGVQHRDLQRQATGCALELAGKIRGFAREAPELWKYQPHKFTDVTEDFHPALEMAAFQVLDERGAPIDGYRFQRPGTGLRTPWSFFADVYHTRGTAPIRFNNRQIGTVVFFAADTRLLRNTGILLLVATMAGTLLALLVYLLPTRVVTRLEAQLKSATDFSHTVLESISDAVSIIDTDTFRILGANTAFLQQVGRGEAEVMGGCCYALTHGLDQPCPLPDDPCPLRQTVETGGMAVADHLHHLPGGKILYVEVATSPIFDEQGRVTKVVHVTRDISDRKRAEEQLAAYARQQAQLALDDELTGLHNRRGFLSLGSQQLKTAERYGKKLLLLFVDLDGMKQINDQLGHQMGDQALQETARLLRDTFREADVLARLGGDEFAVLAMGASGGGASVVKRLTDRVAAVNRGDDRSYQLSVSIGVTVFDPATPCSIDELLVRGDALMYAQKQQKKGAPPSRISPLPQE